MSSVLKISNEKNRGEILLKYIGRNVPLEFILDWVQSEEPLRITYY